MSEQCHSVPSRARLSKEEFVQEYVLKRQPVLIKGALNQWNALNWTPQYLKDRSASRLLSYRTESGAATARFGDLVDLIFSGSLETPAPYLRNIDLRAWLPELAADINPLPVYAADNWRSHPLMLNAWPPDVRKELYELFVSRADTAFPYLHIDYWGMSAFLAQILGEKEVILFPAEDAPYLYPTAKNPLKSSVDDLDNPDYEKFPRLQEARQYRVTLCPGDLLFNPGWWHTTRTIRTSVTLIWAYWNRHEWRDLINEVHRGIGWKGLPLVAHLRFVAACNRIAPYRRFSGRESATADSAASSRTG